MSKAFNLTGKKFGRLTVVKRVENYVYPNGYHDVQWLCRCDCGNEIVVRAKALTKNNGTKSCGCLQKEMVKKYNLYNLSGSYGIGYTLNGEEFWFDLEDYDLIKNYCWFITDKGYVRTTDANNNFKPIYLHRLIMNVSDDYYVDHIHGANSRHDNRKFNLRIATASQNQMNVNLSINNTSGATGVNWDKRKHKWTARIGINYERIHLGDFDSFEDAVRARKLAEDKYFGEFSYDNSMNMEVC